MVGDGNTGVAWVSFLSLASLRGWRCERGQRRCRTPPMKMHLLFYGEGASSWGEATARRALSIVKRVSEEKDDKIRAAKKANTHPTSRRRQQLSGPPASSQTASARNSSQSFRRWRRTLRSCSSLWLRPRLTPPRCEPLKGERYWKPPQRQNSPRDSEHVVDFVSLVFTAAHCA